jgi:hypothetical protein
MNSTMVAFTAPVYNLEASSILVAYIIGWWERVHWKW